MQLYGVFVVFVGVLCGISTSPNNGQLCNVMSIVSTTLIRVIVLASPTVTAAYKKDLVANSVPVVLSLQPAEPESHLELVHTTNRQPPKPKPAPAVVDSIAPPKPTHSRIIDVVGFTETKAVDTTESEHTLGIEAIAPPKPKRTPVIDSLGCPPPHPEYTPVHYLGVGPVLPPTAEQCSFINSIIHPTPEPESTRASSPPALNADRSFIDLAPRGLDSDSPSLIRNATVTDLTTSATITTGPYYFSVSDGTTIWLDGRTPPPSVSIVQHTSTIYVVPVASAPTKTSLRRTYSPIPTARPFNSSSSTSYEHNATTTITEVLTHYLTKTLTEASNPGASSGSAPRWINTTGRGVGSPLSYTHATGASNNLAQPTKIDSSEHNSLTEEMHLNVARQLGIVVVATINGATVSWTNDYDGSDLTNSYPFAPPPTTLISVVKTTATASLSASDTIVSPGSISSISIASVTPSSIPTTTELIPTGPVATSSAPALSTSCSQSTFSKATVSTLVTSTTSTSAAAASSSAACSVTVRNPNNKGDFTVNFDDLPKFGASANDTQYPPIFSPYHHLNWVTGFAYVPPPTDPYTPISKPQLAAFLENPADNVHSNNGTDAGSFGVGDDLSQSALYFNAYSVYIGCTNKGPSQCEITFNGYIYEPYFQNQALDALQVVYQPPCPTLTNCGMLFIPFNDEFKNLTTMQITATVDGSPVDWYMDNLELGWADNSCGALEYRQNEL